MGLKEYSKKRNLKKSPEPKAVVKKGADKIYVIQKHAAKRLHFDLRLEYKGVLKSWAVPKEPPKKAGVKRLAIHVEDHPVEYAKFKGVIPEGYGAGKVEIWDKGTYELLEHSKNKWLINIKGKKLKGEYALVLFRPPKNWLFFKVKK